jgi:hypothetical protein
MTTLSLLEQLASSEPLPVEQFLSELARIFHVRQHEIALFTLNNSMLRFLFPAELRMAGAIPVNGSSLVARTALTQKAEFFNSFATVRHSSIFETIKVGTTTELDPSTMVIQKLMTAPVVNPAGELAGVLQVSRKGPSLHNSGPDFTAEDLRLLEGAARLIGRILPALQETAAAH